MLSPEQKHRIFRILCRVVLLIVLLGAAGAAAAAFKYRSSRNSAEPAVIFKSAEKDKTGKIRIGEKLRFSAIVKIPWGRSIASFEAEPGKNSQLASQPSYERKAIRWGYDLWQFSADIQPYRPGEISGGRMILLLEGGKEKKQELNILLPSFQAETLPVSEQDQMQLASAGKIAETKKRNPVTIAVIILAAVLLILILLIFRKKAGKTEKIPAWMLALQNIGAIRTDLHEGKSDAEHAIVSLTDILRAYLEENFHLRAEHQTTREFLDELRRGGPLTQNQKNFLKEFLNSADMVKFAKAPADETAFDDAASRAEQLVRETSGSDEDTSGKENGK